MIKEVEGNLLTYPGLEVIGHQCNCLGIMGAGIAKQIKAKNPVLFKKYQWLCKDMPDKHLLLGTIEFIKTDDGKQYIANLFGEYSFCESIAPYEEDGKPRHTDYDALKECFKKLHSWMISKGFVTCGLPYKIGCGLAGGDWNGVVYPMIKKEFEEDEDITLYIVKYNGCMEYNLKSPFKEAFESGDSIDYKLVPGAKTDHTFIRELGYESKMHYDCSFTAPGLPGLSLSSYGDWGTIFVDWADDNVKKIFLDMCNEGIIVPWRVRTYVKEGKDVTTYDFDERGWMKHDKQLGKWVSTKSPYTK